MDNLNFFHASSNCLTGVIPTEIGNLKHLVSLDLSLNDLSGPLPVFPNKITSELSLSLDGNSLTGLIPESYGLLTEGNFRLHMNYLSGDVPESFQQLSFWDYAWPSVIAQRGPGFNMDSIHLRGPKFSVTATDGTQIDDSIYGKNEYTLLFTFTDAEKMSFYDDVYNLYFNYKKKGLEVIGYCGGVTNSELVDLVAMWGFPWKNFRFDGASTMSAYIPFDGENPVWMLDNRYPSVDVVDREGNIVFNPYYTGLELKIVSGGYSGNPYMMQHAIDSLVSFITLRMGEPDPFDPIGPDKPYESTDYSADGLVHSIQNASCGKGINVVLMGDAFSDRLVADGTYEEMMRRAMEGFFSEEPYRSYREFFNVYYVDVVSKNETFYGETTLQTYYGGGSIVGGNNSTVFEYAKKAISEEHISDAVIIVLMNRDYYAGTCYMFASPGGDYGSGASIAYFPTDSFIPEFNGIVSHEAGGHGFAKLADEYDSYQLDYNRGEIPEEEINRYTSEFNQYGWWKNVDFTSDPTKVKWNQFIADSRYVAEEIGVYEGACTYQIGAYRPTINSIMKDNTGGFNAPSRYAIWYRINKLAYGDEWTGTYEDFVEFDLAHRPTTTTTLTKSSNFVEQQFPPLHPPVIVDKDWREVVSGR
jgi:hypothetical protein